MGKYEQQFYRFWNLLTAWVMISIATKLIDLPDDVAEWPRRAAQVVGVVLIMFAGWILDRKRGE